MYTTHKLILPTQNPFFPFCNKPVSKEYNLLYTRTLFNPNHFTIYKHLCIDYKYFTLFSAAAAVSIVHLPSCGHCPRPGNGTMTSYILYRVENKVNCVAGYIQLDVLYFALLFL